MGARKLSKRGQAEEQSPQNARSGGVPTALNPGQQAVQAGGILAGPMVRQDIANDQRMNDMAHQREQERAVERRPATPSPLGRRFSWQARQNKGAVPPAA